MEFFSGSDKTKQETGGRVERSGNNQDLFSSYDNHMTLRYFMAFYDSNRTFTLNKKTLFLKQFLVWLKTKTYLKKLHPKNYIFGTYHQYYPKKLISNSVEIIGMTQPYG